MSLINDALKKAQRLRAEPVPPGEAPSGDGGRVAKRRQPMRAQTVILLCAFAAVLIVFSVVVTVYWLNRPEPAVTRPATIARPAALPPESPAPNIVVPITAPATVAAPSGAVQSAPPTATTGRVSTSPLVPAATPPTSPPTTPSAPTNLVANPPAPAVSSPAAAPLPSPAHASSGPPQPDPKIQAFVDAVRVTGIRSSGAESKVLMNDRVYRVNDLVERTLGLKLIKVEADQLTFVDPRGISYTKNF